MRFGLHGTNRDAWLHPASAARLARLAEEAGFESLWVGEHVVLPDPRVTPSPMEPDDPIFDPIVALTFMAAQTRRVKLGTGIIILPQRNPLVLAKELASLDVLSEGRLICGIGVGFLEPEFRALGIHFDNKGARTDEYLTATQTLWREERPAYAGRFVQYSGIQAFPKRPDIPVVIGGHSPGAYRRSVERAQGWYGFALDPDATAACLIGLREAAARYERPATLGRLEITVAPRGLPDPETVRRFTALGVDRLILNPPRHDSEDDLARFIATAAETLIGKNE